jgi:hypothetical protein
MYGGEGKSIQGLGRYRPRWVNDITMDLKIGWLWTSCIWHRIGIMLEIS